MHVQVVIAVVATLVLLAVPLYLWRRPRGPAALEVASDAGAIVEATDELQCGGADRTGGTEDGDASGLAGRHGHRLFVGGVPVKTGTSGTVGHRRYVVDKLPAAP